MGIFKKINCNSQSLSNTTPPKMQQLAIMAQYTADSTIVAKVVKPQLIAKLALVVEVKHSALEVLPALVEELARGGRRGAVQRHWGTAVDILVAGAVGSGNVRALRSAPCANSYASSRLLELVSVLHVVSTS